MIRSQLSSGRRPPGRSLMAAAAVACAALMTAGCGSGRPMAAGRDAQGAGAAALQYAQALFAGDSRMAGGYVEPASRGAFMLIAGGLKPSSLRSRNLAVGSSTVTGQAAVVILTGTICASATVGTQLSNAASGAMQCVTNADRHSSNPVFDVELTRAASGNWLVVYRAPAMAPISQSGEGGATSSAAGS